MPLPFPIEGLLITIAVTLWIIGTIALFLMGCWAVGLAWDMYVSDLDSLFRSKWAMTGMVMFAIVLFLTTAASVLLGIAFIYGG
jgi:hypothetical protein